MHISISFNISAVLAVLPHFIPLIVSLSYIASKENIRTMVISVIRPAIRDSSEMSPQI
ncbi:ABC transmembrane type-1 domain-containing protein [Caenorhabditis elegans]|uniref:ABC transmembrane type-1 domain-containing protein n=1 Tax=Caenorhabditis elegans TaxID=6239 RepID=Q9XX37_CAEEL|nr:ABC transmembrane type-1 domain-containing protein [Caenorhabditis elegans]CAA21002.2 ABC transmembrane type-1 domain-containing protein [Caenorhabditis elegans]|eukprot:NP_507964.2 Uncharacterized protein CELE_Y38H6C.21 [Caenorhabditis elegans]